MGSEMCIRDRVREFIKMNRQSILKEYPRMNPKCGVTNVSNMTEDERMGVLFILTMMTLNEEIRTELEGKKLSRSSCKQSGKKRKQDKDENGDQTEK